LQRTTPQLQYSFLCLQKCETVHLVSREASLSAVTSFDLQLKEMLMRIYQSHGTIQTF